MGSTVLKPLLPTHPTEIPLFSYVSPNCLWSRASWKLYFNYRINFIVNAAAVEHVEIWTRGSRRSIFETHRTKDRNPWCQFKWWLCVELLALRCLRWVIMKSNSTLSELILDIWSESQQPLSFPFRCIQGLNEWNDIQDFARFAESTQGGRLSILI